MKTLPILIVATLLSVSGCSWDWSGRNKTEARTTQTSGGVTLHGCTYGTGIRPGGGFLTNTNPFPIRIRRVLQFHGETTQSVGLIEPGASLKLESFSAQEGFYIYDQEGIMTGWISCACPTK